MPARLKPREFFRGIGMKRYGWLPGELGTAFHAAVAQRRISERHLLQLGEDFATIGDASRVRDALQQAKKLAKKDAAVAFQFLLRETQKIALKTAKMAGPRKRLVSRRFLTGAALSLALGAGAIKGGFSQLQEAAALRPPERVPASLRAMQGELWESKRFAREVKAHLNELRLSGLLQPTETVSLLVHDLNANKPLVEIAHKEKFKAASLIKPFLMLAAYHKVNSGVAPYRRFSRDVRSMMVESSNDASRRLLHFIGGPAEAERIVQSYGFRDTHISRPIPHNGREYKNHTTASDLNAFLSKLHNRKLISQEYSEEMMAHLDNYRTTRLADFARMLGLDLAGKTGYVHGSHGEATRVSFDNGRRSYNFTIVVHDATKPGSQRGGELEWRNRTETVIKSVFRFVHNKLAGQEARPNP